MAAREPRAKASLEALVESGEVGLPVLHPGGLQLTRKLAEACHAAAGKRLLDVASGTGESACFLAEHFGCRVTGVDRSRFMLAIAEQKARRRGLDVHFYQADAHDLPFAAATFEVVISECTTCALEKRRAVAEMVRVARPGAYVGISDLYWKESAPSSVRMRLEELEGERPESMGGWIELFQQSGLRDVRAHDSSETLAAMAREIRNQMGIRGYLKILLRVLRRWGFNGLARIMKSEKILRSQHLGYALIVGRKA